MSNLPLLLGLGAVYACLFWVCAFMRPGLALALIFASAPFPNDLGGDGALKFSLAEVNLVLALPVFLFRGKRPVGGAVLLASLLYIGVGVFCSFLNWRPTTLMALIQTALYLVYAVTLFGTLAKTEEDYRLGFNGFIVCSLVLAVAVSVSGTGYVLGVHKNNCGAAISAGFLLALELSFQARTRGWRILYQLACLIQAVGLFITVSRGSWLGAIVGTLVIFTLRRQFVLMLRCTVFLALFAAVAWSLLPQAKKDYVLGLSKDDWNIKMRYEMRDFALKQYYSSPVVGVGVGLRKEYDATNLVFCTLAETGVLGLAALGFLMLVVGWNLWQTHLMLPRNSFRFSIVVIAAALLMGKLAHGMVDHYWVRGTLMAAWASVGMAMRVKLDEKRERRRRARRRWLESQQTQVEELELPPAPGELVLERP